MWSKVDAHRPGRWGDCGIERLNQPDGYWSVEFSRGEGEDRETFGNMFPTIRAAKQWADKECGWIGGWLMTGERQSKWEPPKAEPTVKQFVGDGGKTVTVHAELETARAELKQARARIAKLERLIDRAREDTHVMLDNLADD